MISFYAFLSEQQKGDVVIRSFARGVGRSGEPTAAVNVRCLEGVEPEAIPVKHHDGRSIPIDG